MIKHSKTSIPTLAAEPSRGSPLISQNKQQNVCAEQYSVQTNADDLIPLQYTLRDRLGILGRKIRLHNSITNSRDMQMNYKFVQQQTIRGIRHDVIGHQPAQHT